MSAYFCYLLYTDVQTEFAIKICQQLSEIMLSRILCKRESVQVITQHAQTTTILQCEDSPLLLFEK
jgi:hypothetical protein